MGFAGAGDIERIDGSVAAVVQLVKFAVVVSAAVV